MWHCLKKNGYFRAILYADQLKKERETSGKLPDRPVRGDMDKGEIYSL